MNERPDIRASYMPIEHLHAEIVAAPFVSKIAFRSALASLDPNLYRDDTQRLWRETESLLLSRFPGLSTDELISRRDQLWFPSNDTSSSSLSSVLQNSTSLIVDSLGRVGRPNPVQSDISHASLLPDRQRRLLRWLTFALPPDLFLAVSGVNSNLVEKLSPNVAQGLAERGFSEPHLHIGAALTFDILWSSLHYSLAQPSATANMFASPGADFGEGRELGPWLLRGAIARSILAAFLESPNRSDGFANYLHSARPRLIRRFGVLCSERVVSSIYELEQGQMARSSPHFNLLRDDFAMLSQLTTRILSDDLQSLRNLDPVSEWFPDLDSQTPDFQFTKSAFEYIRQVPGDTGFAKVFWQVVRLRVAFYRHVVQRPMTPGLQWFVRTYSRLQPARNGVAIEALMRCAVEQSGPGLRSLEFRTQPMRKMTDLANFVKLVDREAKLLRENAPSEGRNSDSNSSTTLEVGVVFHFSRTRGNNARQGVPAAWNRGGNADPNDAFANASGYRHSGYYVGNRTLAASLANLLTTFPRTLEIVRGVDLCSDELGVPLWAARPLIEHVRLAADRAAKRLYSGRDARRYSLRTTVHAGEDYVHLLGGIRRVGESIEFIPLGEGDRIGHAIALGVDPENWANLVRCVPVSREERLLDLIWTWRLAMRPDSNSELKRWIPWIREHLDRLSENIFGDEDNPGSPAALSEFQKGLHDSRVLKSIGFPTGPRLRETVPRSSHFVFRWLTDRALFRRAQVIDDVQVGAEVPLIIAAQNQVRVDVGRLGIVIEVNPSSNLLIGHLGSLEQHPLWRLRPPIGNKPTAPPVRICIGSDDPITFATDLPHEYQLVFDAMTESGMSADECDAWIEDIRRTGLDSRFTVPRSGRDLWVPFTLDRSPVYL